MYILYKGYKMWLFRAVVVLFVMNSVKCACPGVVSREAWGAEAALRVEYMNPPVDIVIIQHTVTPLCFTDSVCEATMRAIQINDNNGLNHRDIAASFYVGGNGKIYEGRGWFRVGRHTFGYNPISIGINFIGNYNTNAPSDDQLRAVRDLLRCGVEKRYLSEDFDLVGQNQLLNTESPGRKLYAVIQQWPEWLEDTYTLRG